MMIIWHCKTQNYDMIDRGTVAIIMLHVYSLSNKKTYPMPLWKMTAKLKIEF